MAGFRLVFRLWRVALAAVVFAIAVFLPVSVSAQTERSLFKSLYMFQGQPDGGGPEAGLIRDNQGNLYGTTWSGGSGKCYDGYEAGCGTVFKLDPTGKETVLYSFAGYPTDGQYPLAKLLRDSAGNLYGTTSQGGSVVQGGTVFRIDPQGNETILYEFTGKEDGANPLGSLIRDVAGNLYGTTSGGGNLDYCQGYGCGTVFKLSPEGVETVLHGFTDTPDAAGPQAELLMDSAGNLYGTTIGGGIYGLGSAFRLASRAGGGWTETVLHSFAGSPDGNFPVGGLIRDAKGNLYGTTRQGGSGQYCASGCGMVFELGPAGKERALHNFEGMGGGDGSDPMGALVRDKIGNLYGTTLTGGPTEGGTLFRLSPSGKEALHFPRGRAGHYPGPTLVMDSSGNLYGTTFGGGDANCSDNGVTDSGCGGVFELLSGKQREFR